MTGTATIVSINNYHYRRGGADVLFLEHNRLLDDLGWRVVPFAMRHPRNLPSPWERYFVEEVELGNAYGPLDKLRKAAKAMYSFEARRKLAALIDETSPALCHAHNVYHHISPSILSLASARGLPLVMTLHDLKLACPNYTMLNRGEVCERCKGGKLYNVALSRCMKGSLPLSAWTMVESYLHGWLRSYARNVDVFLVPSRFFIDKFVEWGFDPKRFVHVPNFVAVEHVKPSYASGNRIVYVGRLSREKGLPTLVRAAALAKVGVTLVGTGPESENLVTLAREERADVLFAGYLSGQDLQEAVRSARAVVLPSECYENGPLAVLEAYALGKPVLGSQLGGIPEHIVPGITGFVFPARDVEALAGVLRSVADAPDGTIAEMGRAGRALVEREFSPPRYVERIHSVYQGLGVQAPERVQPALSRTG
jgi:glycosyltransferase involved in cell wall biosynthesis